MAAQQGGLRAGLTWGRAALNDFSPGAALANLAWLYNVLVVPPSSPVKSVPDLIERAKEIVAQEGTALALAARDMNEDGLREAGQLLGAAISEALLEVFDGLLGQEDS